MKSQHDVPEALLNAFDDLWDAQKRYSAAKDSKIAAEVAEAKILRDAAKSKFDRLLEREDDQ